MIIASHQPYFFPYLGYFSLISAADQFVFFDTSQYMHRSWMRRNRILNNNVSEPVNITIGVKKPLFKANLPECKLASDEKWKKLLIAQLEHYKRKAYYFEETMFILRGILMKEEELLVDFNINSTIAIVRELNISTPILQLSSFQDKVENTSGGYWGINICKALEADTYINAPGGEEFYPKDAYKEAGIKLGFIQHKLFPYSQKINKFIPGLSIIDVLMFNGIKRTSEMIHDYTIKWINE